MGKPRPGSCRFLGPGRLRCSPDRRWPPRCSGGSAFGIPCALDLRLKLWRQLQPRQTLKSVSSRRTISRCLSKIRGKSFIWPIRRQLPQRASQLWSLSLKWIKGIIEVERFIWFIHLLWSSSPKPTEVNGFWLCFMKEAVLFCCSLAEKMFWLIIQRGEEDFRIFFYNLKQICRYKSLFFHSPDVFYTEISEGCHFRIRKQILF